MFDYTINISGRTRLMISITTGAFRDVRSRSLVASRSLKENVDPSWIKNKKKFEGPEDQFRQVDYLNRKVQAVVTALEGVFDRYLLQHDNKLPTPAEVMKIYIETIEPNLKFLKPRRLTFVALVKEYMEMKRMTPKSMTHFAYCTMPLLTNFMHHEYQGQVYVDQVDTLFLTRLDFFILTNKVKGYKKTVMRANTQEAYRTKVHNLVDFAFRRGYIKDDPMTRYYRYSIPPEDEKRIHRDIQPEWLVKIATEPAPDDLKRTRLLFLLQTWTGLSFIDMCHYNIRDCISRDMTGNTSIMYNRIKSDEVAIIPYFEETEALLTELSFIIRPAYAEVFETNRIYYKDEVKRLLAYYKVPTTGTIGAHTGRHVFGERMLDKGYSMESVSRMMGHAKVSTTQQYYPKIDGTAVFMDHNRLMEQQRVLKNLQAYEYDKAVKKL